MGKALLQRSWRTSLRCHLGSEGGALRRRMRTIISPSTARSVARRSRRTRPSSRCCATASICSARARAARRACAAAAPCWSMAPPCPAASISRPSSTADGDDRRGSRAGRQAHAGAGSLPRGRRVAVRLLHAGLRADGEAAARRASRSRRRRDPALSLRQSLPLRRLSGDHRRREACGRFEAGRT